MLRKLLAKHKRKLNSIFGIVLCMALLAGLVSSVDISAAENAAAEDAAGGTVEEAESADDTAETQEAETAAAADGEVAFRAEAEGITVVATAREGVLPEGAAIHVTLLEAEDEETKDQYTGAEEALMDHDVGYEGMAAMDICFTDAEGNEVEPEEGSVSVKIDMDVSLLGDDIDTDSLTVWHLAETAEDSIEVRSVADAADETEGTVAVEDDTMTAEFEVEDFSTYTVTWTYPKPNKTATLHFVDEDGNDISEVLGASGSQTVSGTGSLTDSGLNGEDGLNNVGSQYNGQSDYYYVTAHLDSYTGTAVTDISYNNGWWYYVGGKWYTWNDSKGDQKDNGSVDVYLVYTKDTLSTVKTVDSESMGITIRMIDYSSAANDIAIGGGYKSNGSITQGLLKNTLGSDGYPVTANGESLESLFSGGSAVDANHLFLQSTYDDTGYLEYSSFENYAYLNSDGDFTVYNQIGTPSNEVQVHYRRGNFMPYNEIINGDFSTNTNMYDEDGNALPETDSRYNEKLYLTQGTNYYFGMYLEVNFYQPENGLVESGDQMIYEFTGDDDLWVYIDDVLVLDIGGIHDAHSGYINMATGEVYVDTGTGTPQTTTIKAMYKAAGIFPDGTAWDDARVAEYFSGETFADYTAHTLKMFYMERGAGASNLHMKFNLPVVKSGEIKVKKELSNTDKEKYADVEFAFQVYLQKIESTGQDGVQTYEDSYEKLTKELRAKKTGIKITDDDGNTVTLDDNGYFYLKPGQTVTISGLQANRLYYVAEVGVQSDYYDKVSVNNTTVYEYDETGGASETTDAETSKAQVSKRPIVKFTNNCSGQNNRELRITKAMANGQTTEDTFDFKIQLENQSGALEDYVGDYYLVDASGNYYYYSGGILKSNGTTAIVCGTLTSADGGVVSRVPAGYTVVITQILSGTSFLVEEVNLDTATYEAYSKTLTAGTYTTEGMVSGADGEILLGKDAEVTITNSLKPGYLTITKKVDGIAAADLSGIAAGTYTFEVKDSSGNVIKKVALPTSSGEWTITIGNLPAGTYTVTEEDPADVDGYKWLSVRSTDGGTSGGATISATVPADGTAAVTYTNTYEKLYSLSVTKEVTGNMGDTSKTFHFTVVVKDSSGTAVSLDGDYTDSSGNTITVSDGAFQLSDGQTLVIGNLRQGYTYTVTEASYSSEGYTTKVYVNGDETGDETNSVKGQVSNQDTVVRVVNEKNVDTPTGLTRNIKPYLLSMIIALGGAFLLFAIRRRRI